MDAWEVWDRALDERFAPSRAGDTGLRNALRFHGLVRNGGLVYAVVTDHEAAVPAAEGLRVLGAVEVADVVARAGKIAGRLRATSDQVNILELTDAEIDELESLSDRYSTLLPMDTTLVEIVQRYLDSNADAFDPL